MGKANDAFETSNPLAVGLRLYRVRERCCCGMKAAK
jgi:hypothetical protein